MRAEYGYSPSYRLLPGLIACGCLLGCGATTRMQPGVPLEVNRGYCFLVRTNFKQRGRPVSTGDTLNQLERYPASRPRVRDGRALDVAALAVVIAGTSTWLVGDLGKAGQIEMSERESTALIASGFGVAVAGGCSAWRQTASTRTLPLRTMRASRGRRTTRATIEPPRRPRTRSDMVATGAALLRRSHHERGMRHVESPI